MDMLQTFNLVDIGALVVVAVGTFVGYRRGLSGELARLVSIVAAFVLGLFFFRPVGAWIVNHTRLEDRSAQAVAFMVTIGAALVAMVLLRIVLKRVMQVVFEEMTDKVGGAIAGFVRAALTVAIIVMMVNTWPHDYLNRQFGEESVIGRLVLKYVPILREKVEELPVSNKVKETFTESKEKIAREIKEEIDSPSVSKAVEQAGEEAVKKRKWWFSREKE